MTNAERHATEETEGHKWRRQGVWGEQWGDGGRGGGAAGKQASIEREECSKVQRYEISRDKQVAGDRGTCPSV